MKCQRCGNEPIIDATQQLSESSGAEATMIVWLKGRNGLLMADVCNTCGQMLKRLGWS